MFNFLKSKSNVTFKSVFLLLIAAYLISSSPAKTWQLPSYSQAIVFSPDSKMLATAAGAPKDYYVLPNNNKSDSSSQASSTVEIRRVPNGKVIQTLDFPYATSLAFSPDNNLIATGNSGKEIKVWRISDGQLLYSLPKPGAPSLFGNQTNILAFTPDEQTLIASAGIYSPRSKKPNYFTAWNLSNGKNRYIVSQPNSCAAVSTEKQIFALGEETEPLTLYRLQDGTKLKTLNINKPSICYHLALSQDGKLLASEFPLNQKSGTYIYNLENGKLLRIISNRDPYRDTQGLTDIALSPNNRYLATSYDVAYTGTGWVGFEPSIPKAFSGRIRIWNVKTGRLVTSLWGHRKGTNTIIFSPNGHWLASTGKDNTIHIWRMPPHNYFLWLLVSVCLTALAYWQRDWLNRFMLRG
jgi:WD40 repeat protein